MTKTPDEIKKGLECCATVKVGGVCPFDCPLQPLCASGDDGAVQREILALIQQLQQNNAQLAIDKAILAAENAEKDARIRVLESRNNALYHTILGVMHFVDKWLDVPAYDPDEDLHGTTAIGRASQARETTLQAIEQLEAERDAAVADIRLAFTSYVGTCQTCKHGENQVDCIEPLRCGNCENEKCKCQSCDSYDSNWEWRGVQKEDGDA